jgi:tRNA (cytidine56-2'-O)-methyltransferase
MKTTILRLGHRIKRDERVSTHCALVSRALGASGMIYCGQKDKGFEDSVKNVSENWGGNFEITFEENWKNVVKNWDGKIIYLTMYGINLPEIAEEIKNLENVLLVVGSEKVPPELYDYVDYQVAVTNQPHSEIAALGIFLDWVSGHRLDKKFEGKMEITPKIKGKNVRKKTN